mgnify:CR=1 FL=1
MFASCLAPLLWPSPLVDPFIATPRARRNASSICPSVAARPCHGFAHGDDASGDQDRRFDLAAGLAKRGVRFGLADTGDHANDSSARSRNFALSAFRLTISPDGRGRVRTPSTTRACQARPFARCLPPTVSSPAGSLHRYRGKIGASAPDSRRRTRTMRDGDHEGAATACLRCGGDGEGVRPLADTAITASLARSPNAAIACSPATPPSSAAASMRNGSAVPPARMMVMRLSSRPKVPGSSAASSAAARPDEPAPA